MATELWMWLLQHPPHRVRQERRAMEEMGGIMAALVEVGVRAEKAAVAERAGAHRVREALSLRPNRLLLELELDPPADLRARLGVSVAEQEAGRAVGRAAGQVAEVPAKETVAVA